MVYNHELDKRGVEIIYDAVRKYSYPICFNFPAGHIKDNRALVMEQKTTLQITPTTVQFF
ncbi:hypothetical protein KXJ69_10215 [Aureisphaera sp. CAU 1614]|uniref:LD-carboxypeptidase C-terminal domain-containing protein n=1 Tax=Halomarinibacterium sedimenti TaxID=2857106 RepID=A0A9X1FQC3_9FLAO|nr:hypothetical protein [Halomarinibacterium sedimenti]MBW2938483.1 hypothetical protein [Halomarinibacterium sedimenti]